MIHKHAHCDKGKKIKMSNLNNREIARYSRQIILPCIGMSGQCSLKAAKVLIVGAGGLGCPVASNLAGAGIGKQIILLN